MIPVYASYLPGDQPLFTYLRPMDQGLGDGYLFWPGLTIGGSF